MNSTTKKAIIGGLAAMLLVLLWFVAQAKVVEIATRNTIYASSDFIEVSIRNESGRPVCFSSCYPYYLEKHSSQWEGYDYANCGQSDVAGQCIPAKDVKAFQLVTDTIETGKYRIKVPVCTGCAEGEPFRKDSVEYSNEFEVR